MATKETHVGHQWVFVVAVVLTAGLGIVGCKRSGPPGTQSAIAHYYASGCVITSGEDQLSEDQAVSIVQGILDDNPSCRGEHEALRSCLYGIEEGDCDGCDPEIELLNACFL